MPKSSPDGRSAGAHMQVAGGGWSTVSGASMESALPIIASPRGRACPPTGADGWLHATWGAARRQGPAQPRKWTPRYVPNDRDATACLTSWTPLHVTTASGDRRPLPDLHANRGGPRQQQDADWAEQWPGVEPLAPGLHRPAPLLRPPRPRLRSRRASRDVTSARSVRAQQGRFRRVCALGPLRRRSRRLALRPGSRSGDRGLLGERGITGDNATDIPHGEQRLPFKDVPDMTTRGALTPRRTPL